VAAWQHIGNGGSISGEKREKRNESQWQRKRKACEQQHGDNNVKNGVKSIIEKSA
jgi:hypothetical protein